MIQIELDLDLKYTVLEPTASFFFLIHAAHTQHQRVQHEDLFIDSHDASWELQELEHGQRCLRVLATQGPLQVRYVATVDIAHHTEEPSLIAETPVSLLPTEVLQYIYPSRYCQSDRLAHFAMREFGHLPQGYALVQAVCD